MALPATVADGISVTARERLLDVAEPLLDGHWTALGVARHDLKSPDWFRDPVSERAAPRDRYSFSINHRNEEEVGNIKQVWELSRHHHLTVLAAAWFLTRDDRYADMVAQHLASWWSENPFLSGVHWTSGIELGVRLISWTWVRRLLNDWPSIGDFFERNEQAIRQLHWHQQYLAAFTSRGSSANNHVIAEAAGQLIASCALPWFAESDDWRRRATALLERELGQNTFASGVNRELATAYHGFVAELGLLAAVEADAAGHPLSDQTWSLLGRMLDVAASLVDVRQRPPRQGDGDDGATLVVDNSDGESWSSLLAAGAAAFGPLSWWPSTSADVRSGLIAAMRGGIHASTDRPTRRQSHFADAGVTILRTLAGQSPEVWCRCDGGPHGFLSIAAHAHADALSIEVRHGGVDVLADPGTYCYHSDPEWRAYFRSTAAHNTLEIGGRDQSRSGGPFLWHDQARTRVLRVAVDSEDGAELWSAEHDGYRALQPPAIHRRSVAFDKATLRLTVKDEVVAREGCAVRLAFHFGPAVEVTELDLGLAQLRWTAGETEEVARLLLPRELHWTLLRGSTDPIAGWYSPRFGVKAPAATLFGAGFCGMGDELFTVLDFGVVASPGAAQSADGGGAGP